MSDWVDETLNKKTRDESFNCALNLVKEYKKNGFSQDEALAMYSVVHMSQPQEIRHFVMVLFLMWKEQLMFTSWNIMMFNLRFL